MSISQVSAVRPELMTPIFLPTSSAAPTTRPRGARVEESYSMRLPLS
jgi:hypothetical protein